MSDYSDMLDLVKIPLRESANTLVSDADILKFYNEGGRKFADMTACIRDAWLVPIVPTTPWAMTYQAITDADNTFELITVSASLEIYRYKIAKCLWIDRMWLRGCDERTDDIPINRIGDNEIEDCQFLDPSNDDDYPKAFRFFLAGEFDLYPIFTNTTASLYIEGRRHWLEVDATTQTTCYLPERFKDAPINYARWLAGLQVRDFEFANESKEAFYNDVARGLAEINKEDMAGGLIRSIVTH